MAIAPYLKFNCVPDVSLENISLKFKESTFFERTAIHEPGGVMTSAGCPLVSHDERLARNRARLKTQLARESARRAGHA